MNIETPERPRNYYQRQRDKLVSAVTRWQMDTTGEATISGRDVARLEDFLNEEDLQILPQVAESGNWRVLVDGEPAPYPGQDRPAGPVDADVAAEMFLLQAAKGETREVTVRPATNDAMVQMTVLGDTTVREEPVQIDAESYVIISDAEGSYRVLSFSDGKGRIVRVKFGKDLFELLETSVHDEMDAWDNASGGGAA